MKENASIVYFLTRSLFLGFGISLLISSSSKDAYFGALLGLLLGIIITHFYAYIIKNKPKTSLISLYKKDKIVGFITRILMFLISYLILLYTLIIYIVFVISFLLISSPEYYVIIPYIILACYLAFKGLNNINKVASILLPLSLVFTVLGFLGLLNTFNITNFFPILTNTFKDFIFSACAFAGISAFPNILSLHLSNNIKNYHKYYILSGVIIILTIIWINGVFGDSLMRIFRFPEYMMLKQIKLFKFIEKVENIFSTVWIFDLFITSSMAIYFLKESLPQKKAYPVQA